MSGDGVKFVKFLLFALAACKPKAETIAEDPPAPPPVRDAPPPIDAPAWPELAELPRIDAVKVVALPVRADIPRFEVGGPVLAGDIAVVASSQFGFLGVDWRRGTIAWSKPSGLHVAPPAVVGGDVVLIGSCVNPPDIPDTLLGCLRVVTPAGADQTLIAIHGRKIDAFATSAGTQDVWPAGEHAVRWRRGESAVQIDLISGVATPASIDPPPLVVTYKERTWEIRQQDGAIVASQHGREAWRTGRRYTQLLGAVYLPEQSPMVRAVNAGPFRGHAEVTLFDIDATGSLHGQVAFPVPGIGILGHAISSVGDAAIAVRLDNSIQRDFIVGYAANALMMWVYPLPVVPRADPVGLAITPDAVVAFHDGDTFTILPELSAPPTAPGAVRAPSQNPTP